MCDSFTQSRVQSNHIQGCYLSYSTNPQQQFLDFKLETYTPGLCSHIFFSYSNIKNDFKMDALNTGQLKWGDGNKFYNQLNEIKSQQPELKAILSLGGTYDFKDLVSDAEKRKFFIQSVVGFVDQFKFDGVDIDISQSFISKNVSTTLIKELKNSVISKLITVSVSTDENKGFDINYDVPSFEKYTDFVNILTPKNTVKKSNSIIPDNSANSNTFDAMYNWVSNGMSKSKIVIGMTISDDNSIFSNTKCGSNANETFTVLMHDKWMKENGFAGGFMRFLDGSCDGNPAEEKRLQLGHDLDDHIPNNDLLYTSGQLEDCCDLCAGSTGCLAWVWKPEQGGICLFKSATGLTVPAVGSTVGIPCNSAIMKSKLNLTAGRKTKHEL
uniref:GH18 domain-containing protein n=1 Tax=Panagrolaimus davidi TaxID=227884 RepID=A0A914PXQ6_9BILA